MLVYVIISTIWDNRQYRYFCNVSHISKTNIIANISPNRIHIYQMGKLYIHSKLVSRSSFTASWFQKDRFVQTRLSIMTEKSPGPRFNLKCLLASMGNPIVEIRRTYYQPPRRLGVSANCEIGCLYHNYFTIHIIGTLSAELTGHRWVPMIKNL